MNSEKQFKPPEAESGQEEQNVVKDYKEQLDLSPEDLKKKILDIGSGDGSGFGTKIREMGSGSQIYSLDPRPGTNDSVNFTTGQAEHLPFNDKEFELVVSNAAFPFFVLMDKEINRQLRSGNLEPAENRIRQDVNEMLRVINDKAEIRLGRVSKNIILPHQRVLEQCFEKVLNEFIQNKLVTVEWKQKEPLMDYQDTTKKLADLYLVILHKL